MILFGKIKQLMKDLKNANLKIEEQKENIKNLKDYIVQIQEEIKNKNNLMDKQKFQIQELNDKCVKLSSENKKAELNISSLKREKKILQGAKGGYKAENNKLKKQVSELSKKLDESMSNKYLVKKIPSGRRPKGMPMMFKSSSKQSQIIKSVKEQ